MKKKLLWVFLLIFSIIACQARPEQVKGVSTLAPLPQDPLIEAYFNQSQAHQYTDPYREIQRPGDDLEALVVNTIAAAQSSVAVAVQEIRLPLVAKALINKQRSGVSVRVIVENTYNNTLPELQASLPPTAAEDDREANKVKEMMALVDLNHDGQASSQELLERDAIYMLRAAKVPLIDDRADGSEGTGLMHHKFIIVDDRLVIAGSANLTPSDVHGDLLAPETRGNANHLLKFQSPALAQFFRQEFNLMWGDGPGGKLDSKFGVNKPKRSPQPVTIGGTIVTVNFSPRSDSDPFEETSNGLIARTLRSARQEADMALFVFSEQRLADALLTSHQQGTAVKVLIDPGFAFRDYSEGLDLLGVALPGRNCRLETNNHPWNPPIASVGVPQLAKGDKLHHKFGVLDHQTIVTGSHNWSHSANNTNDETLLVLTNTTVAAHFQREFDRLYTTASLGLPSTVAKKIAAAKQRCHL